MPRFIQEAGSRPIPASPATRRSPPTRGSPAATAQRRNSAPATPTGAQCTRTANSPTTVPPLGRSSLEFLVERFGAIQLGGTPLVHPPDRASLLKQKPEQFRTRLDTHLETHKLKKSEEEMNGVKQYVIVQRPAVDKVVYFVRLDAHAMDDLRAGLGKLDIYAVPSEAMAAQMHARGYTRVRVSHLGDDTHLPPKITSSAAEAAAVRRRSLAPLETKLPASGFPAANNIGAESAAQQIVREWELHVDIDGSFYSPAYKWTMAARKRAGAEHADLTCMSVCNAYMSIMHTPSIYYDMHVSMYCIYVSNTLRSVLTCMSICTASMSVTPVDLF